MMRAGALLCQSRIYQRGGHVPRPRPPGPDLLSRYDGGTRRRSRWRPMASPSSRSRVTGIWRAVLDSPHHRRISPSNTAITVDGPAAGHDRIKTKADPTGRAFSARSTIVPAEVTPWGTYLTAEENFHGYFWSDACAPRGKPPEGLGGAQPSYERYGVPGLWQPGANLWTASMSTRRRTSRTVSAGSSNRSTRSASIPVKHTALGRFRHEGAECLHQHGRPRGDLFRRRWALRLCLSLRLRRPIRS